MKFFFIQLTCQSGRPGMMNTVCKCFCNAKTMETLVELKQLKLKKCTLRPSCCVYMHDRYVFVLVNVETLLYMDHLLTTYLDTHHT